MLETEDAATVTCEAVTQTILSCDELGFNNQMSNKVFSLWMKSSLLGKFVNFIK